MRILECAIARALKYSHFIRAETDLPFTSGPRLPTEQQVDLGCKSLSNDSPRGDPTCTNPVSENDLKSHSPAKSQENEKAISANPCTAAGSDREANEILKQSIVGAGFEGCHTLDGGPTVCPQTVLL